MLRKLLKHEFRATGRIMLPMYLIMLIISVLGNFAVRIMDNSKNTYLKILPVIIIVAFVVMVIGLVIMSIYMTINRFSKNLMGDEGYIMFTLPVSVHKHIISKIIVSVVWFVATFLVLALACVLIAFRAEFIQNIVKFFKRIIEGMTTYYALNGTAVILELLAVTVASLAAFCLQVYAAISLGYGFTRHKALLSVAAFVVMQIIMWVIVGAAVSAIDANQIDYWVTQRFSSMGQVHITMCASFVINVLYGAVYYVITALGLKKRLNLE